MTALETLAALAGLARDPAARVPSPCISVCRMDGARGLCSGCFRTIDEIMAWGGQSESGKRAVWRLITLRAGVDVREARSNCS